MLKFCGKFTSPFHTTVIIIFLSNSLRMLFLGARGTSGTSGGMGGQGGDGGEGGFFGSIKINNDTVQDSGRQALDSAKGQDGCGGIRGTDGNSAGDIAVQSSLSISIISYGFDYDKQLSLEYSLSSDTGFLCFKNGMKEYCYVDIKDRGSKNAIKTLQTKQTLKNEIGRAKEKKSAMKKKEILSEHVSAYVNKVEEKKRGLEMFFNQMNEMSKNMQGLFGLNASEEEKCRENVQERIQSIKKFRQPRNLTKLDQKEEKIIKDEYPNTIWKKNCKHCKNYSKIEHSVENSRIPLPFDLMVRCLSKSATVDDVDSIIHCIFGDKDSDEIITCKNVSEHRAALARFVEENMSNTDTKPILTSIAKKFVMNVRSEKRQPIAWGIKQDCKAFEETRCTLWTQLMVEFENSQNDEVKALFQPENMMFACNENGKKETKKALENCSNDVLSLVENLTKKFDWELALSPNPDAPNFYEEYSKFIIKETTTLGKPELELLAFVYGKRIHIFREAETYEEREDETAFVFIETLNPDGGDEHNILTRGNGTWQRLDWDVLQKTFYEKRYNKAIFFKNIFDNQELSAEKHFKQLVNFVKEKNEPEVLRKIQHINPEYGFPDAISKELLKRYKSQDIKICPEDTCLLLKKIVSSCIIKDQMVFTFLFCDIIRNVCPNNWSYEVFIIEIEDSLKKVLDSEEKANIRKCLQKIGTKTFHLIRVQLLKTNNLDYCRLKRVLYLLSNKLKFTKDDFERLQQLSLNDWVYELKFKFWLQRVESLENIDIYSRSYHKKLVYELLNFENNFGFERCNKLISDPNLKLKDLEEILIADGENPLERKERCFADILNILKREAQISNSEILKLFEAHLDGKSKFYQTVPDVKEWAKDKRDKIKFPEDIDEFISVYNYAVEKIMGFMLRHTQQVTLIAFLSAKRNTLCQVNTGEGKSLIVAGIAIAHALSGEKVDVITSNNLLAIRDSTQDVKNGGLLDIYKAFDMTVANNCSHDEEKRKTAYNSDIVYGELSNFQRDHLLQTFYGRNIKGDRAFEYIVVDEVDSMLLDNGNNVLFLSHNIPGFETLESLFVYIWERVNMSSSSLEEIKADIVYDLYGEIVKNDLKSVLPSTAGVEDTNALWVHLIKTGVISHQGRLLINSLQDLTTDKFYNLDWPELTPKLVFFFKNIFERQRRIKLPKHLFSFVDQHLDSWLSSAVQAMLLKPEQHYVVDKARSSSSNDFNSQIIIIDQNTGMDQESSQWDSALHQFIQLKEGCQITELTLKAVFVSNVSFVRMYNCFSGLSGTIGSEPERDYLLDIYKADYIIMPTAFPKLFQNNKGKVLNHWNEWIKEICNEAKNTVRNGRSILIFCDSISSVRELRDYLSRDKGVQQENLHCYTRDYENFSFESKALDIGHIILSTNLAGRGTDIKLSTELKQNGGLHICLTYLADSFRTEEQAFGRAARKGEPGSGILILLEECSTIHSGKFFQLKMDRNLSEIKHISEIKENFEENTMFHEHCFLKFSKVFKQLQKKIEHHDPDVKDFLNKSALDFWAMLLDSIESRRMKCKKKKLLLLKIELRKLSCVTSTESSQDLIKSSLGWSMSPARTVAFAKYLATKEKNFSLAKYLLDKLITEDEFWYPQAHYYKALILVNETENFQEVKSNFIKELYHTERLLDEHIQMQMMFTGVIKKIYESKFQGKMFPMNAYKEQKENVVHLFEIIKGSISKILGASCSESGLANDTGIDSRRAEFVFQKLVDLQLIKLYEVTDCQKVPDKEATIKNISDEYDTNISIINNFLIDLKGQNYTEKELKVKMKSAKILNCTREEFWDQLVTDGILIQNIKCLVVPKSEKLEGIQEVTLTENQILYIPHLKSLENDNKTIVFESEKNKIATEMTKDFEPNKIATLNKVMLEKLDFSCYGKLVPDDFKIEGIAEESERIKLWDSLVQLGIIDSNGSLENYKPFTYPDCSAYEPTVNNALQRKFRLVGILKRLDSKDDSSHTAMNILPLNAYRSLLLDMLDSRLISLPHVPDSIDFGILRTDFPDEKERTLIESYLKSHQSTYASLETVAASLKPVSEAIDGSDAHKNIGTEVDTLASSGFDDLIELSEKSW